MTVPQSAWTDAVVGSRRRTAVLASLPHLVPPLAAAAAATGLSVALTSPGSLAAAATATLWVLVPAVLAVAAVAGVAADRVRQVRSASVALLVGAMITAWFVLVISNVPGVLYGIVLGGGAATAGVLAGRGHRLAAVTATLATAIGLSLGPDLITTVLGPAPLGIV